MGQKLRNAPLYFALAQVGFNPVVAMAKYVPEIQDRLRRVGYTEFETQETVQLELRPDRSDKRTVTPEVHTNTAWLISDEQRHRGFILDSGSISFQTTRYETSASFLPELIRGLRAVHEVVDLSFIRRIGVRYLDAILPQPNETVNAYLQPGLHGVAFPAQRRQAMTESIYDTGNGPVFPTGVLVARVHFHRGPLGYPPDLSPRGLEANLSAQASETEEHAVLDTDHFAEGRAQVDLEQVEWQLQHLHASCTRSFKATITDHALSIWA